MDTYKKSGYGKSVYSKSILLVVVIFSILLLFGCTSSGGGTFLKKDGAKVCTIDGKPVIRLFSTTWCPHCQWIAPIYDSVVNDYVSQGKIVAYHWQMDTLDNTLTDANEGSIPEGEAAIFQEFSPKGSIPVFVFGCEYYRLGNGYEATKDANAETTEMRKIIDELITESK